MLHPAGNVAEHLLGNGLARIVEWHAGMLSSIGGMEKLRAAERSAKDKRLNLFASQSTMVSNGHSGGAASNGQVKVFDATVTRVWSGDQVSVLGKEDVNERRLYLSSIRAPKYNFPITCSTIADHLHYRHSDPRQVVYAQEAREFIRKKLIGKNVKVQIDFVRPREGEFDERECATVRYGGHNA